MSPGPIWLFRIGADGIAREIASRLSEIPTDKEVVVTCRSGNRSSQVATFLRDQGFTNVHNMEGGILAWQQAGLPVE